MKNLNVNIITNYNSYKYTEIRFYLKKIKEFKIIYHGHYAVTRSLINGLKKNNWKFSYNNFKDHFDICWVLSDPKTLKHTIELQKFDKLIAGPNISVLPTDDDKILMSDKIDLLIVPSKWVLNLYRKYTKKKISIWYAGIDENYWKPKNNNFIQNKILIYYKRESKSLLKNTINFLQNKNFKLEIVKYGEYKIGEYKKKLQNSEFAIFINNTESQCIAQVEAWSMNVPTLIWHDKNDQENKFRKYVETSNAPYLNEKNGAIFKNFDELEKLINNIQNKKIKYNPRKWVLKNMTDKISADKAIKIINSLN